MQVKKVEQLTEDDVLNAPRVPATDPEKSSCMVVMEGVRRAQTSPVSWERASQLRKVRTAHKYVYLTTGTLGIVRVLMGTEVSVVTGAPVGRQEGSPAVAEATEATRLRSLKPGETVRFLDEPDKFTLPQPFSYIRHEFGKLSATGPYKVKVTSDEQTGNGLRVAGETRWLNLHPEDLAMLAKLMEDREHGE